MDRNVYVITGRNYVLNDLLETRIRAHPSLENPRSWIYIGKEICTCKKIEETIGESAKRVNIGEDLQALASKYRQDYIDYIGKLSQDNASSLWFLTSLSEKNPFISDFFLHFCYVKLCQKYLLEKKDDLVIVCENRGIFLALQDNLNNCPFHHIEFYDSHPGMVINSLSVRFSRLKNKCVFLSRFLLRIALARIFSAIRLHRPRINAGDPVIIMHSWTDSRSFLEDFSYRDVYFRDVGADLEKDRANFFYLADILPTLWYPKAISRLLRTPQKIFLMEEFLSFRDVITSMLYVHRNYPKSVSDSHMADTNVRALIKYEFEKDLASFRIEQSYLNSYITQAILRRFAVRAFLFTFENHVWEKAFCKGFKTHPETKTLAYAIGFINRMYTCYSRSIFEKTSPEPDVIFVSGSQGRKNLIEFGFDPKKIVVGGAIRYPRIQHPANGSVRSGKKTVLIALSGELKSSIELLHTSIHAFSEMKDITVFIKCHPTVPYSHISGCLPALPEHFEVIEKAVDELLNMTDLLIYTESTVSVEAIAKGIPVLHVKSAFSIDINIFDGMDFVPSSTSPEMIGRISREILFDGKTYPIPEGLVESLFSSVDKSLIEKTILPDDEVRTITAE